MPGLAAGRFASLTLWSRSPRCGGSDDAGDDGSYNRHGGTAETGAVERPTRADRRRLGMAGQRLQRRYRGRSGRPGPVHDRFADEGPRSSRPTATRFAPSTRPTEHGDHDHPRPLDAGRLPGGLAGFDEFLRDLEGAATYAVENGELRSTSSSTQARCASRRPASEDLRRSLERLARLDREASKNLMT